MTDSNAEKPIDVTDALNDIKANNVLKVLGESAIEKAKQQTAVEVRKNSDGTIRVGIGSPGFSQAVSGSIALASELRQALAEQTKEKRGKK